MPSRCALVLAAVLTTLAFAPAAAVARTEGSGVTTSGAAKSGAATGKACPPHAQALSYSDRLDKLVYDGVTVGGLSSLAYDRRSKGYVSAVDNDGSQPERIWFFRNLTSPHVTRKPLILRMPDGTAYTGNDSDNEGLAVLPDGDFLVSSETEPSIRIYARNGVQQSHLRVPARFEVSPKGQATDNATLEGLTIGPRGHQVIAAMEGALSGDVSAKGDATYHRFLVYDVNSRGRWHLAKQIGYRAGPGQRIPEVARYGTRGLLVEEAAYSSTSGNSVRLYAVRNVDAGRNIGAVRNLSSAPKDVVRKTLIADLVECPTLGAPSKETQANPLLDNFEGMAVAATGRRGRYRVSMISDDNFSAEQSTRVLNLSADLP